MLIGLIDVQVDRNQAVDVLEDSVSVQHDGRVVQSRPRACLHSHGTLMASVLSRFGGPQIRVLSIDISSAFNEDGLCTAIRLACERGCKLISMSLGITGAVGRLLATCNWARRQGVCIVASQPTYMEVYPGDSRDVVSVALSGSPRVPPYEWFCMSRVSMEFAVGGFLFQEVIGSGAKPRRPILQVIRQLAACRTKTNGIAMTSIGSAPSASVCAAYIASIINRECSLQDDMTASAMDMLLKRSLNYGQVEEIVNHRIEGTMTQVPLSRTIASSSDADEHEDTSSGHVGTYASGKSFRPLAVDPPPSRLQKEQNSAFAPGSDITVAVTPYSSVFAPLVTHSHMLTGEISVLADPFRHAQLEDQKTLPSFVKTGVSDEHFDQLVIGPPPPHIHDARSGSYIPWPEVATAVERRASIRFCDRPSQSVVDRLTCTWPKAQVLMPGDLLSVTGNDDQADMPPLHSLPLPTVAIYSTVRNSQTFSLHLSLVSELRRAGAQDLSITDYPYSFLFDVSSVPWAGLSYLPSWAEVALHTEQQVLSERIHASEPFDIVVASSRHAVGRFDTRVPTMESPLSLSVSRLTQPDYALLLARVMDSTAYIRACIGVVEGLHCCPVKAIILSPARWNKNLSNSPLELRIGTERRRNVLERRKQLADEFGVPTFILQPRMASLARYVVNLFGGKC